jgi:hypothetical protein
MISLKVLSTAAVVALVVPMVAPAFAQSPQGRAAGVARGGGGGARMMGGAPAARFSGGAPAARFAGAPAARFNGGGGVPAARFNGGGGNRFAGGGGGYYRHRGNAFIPGAVAGALIGGAIASQSYGYYDGGPAYAQGYYDDQGYDDSGVVAVAPAPAGDDGVAYCIQTYRSYDQRSGTYLGSDGYRHPCP